MKPFAFFAFRKPVFTMFPGATFPALRGGLIGGVFMGVIFAGSLVGKAQRPVQGDLLGPSASPAPRGDTNDSGPSGSFETGCPAAEKPTSDAGAPAKESGKENQSSDGVPSVSADAIRRTLEGDRSVGSGDGLLEDVLGVIKSEGSVLDGSLLDQTLETLGDAKQPSKPTKTAAMSLTDGEKRIETAEQLLRSARLLKRLGDPANEPLVEQMRRKASQLLALQFPTSAAVVVPKRR